jgi:hypothetical protein
MSRGPGDIECAILETLSEKGYPLVVIFRQMVPVEFPSPYRI